MHHVVEDNVFVIKHIPGALQRPLCVHHNHRNACSVYNSVHGNIVLRACTFICQLMMMSDVFGPLYRLEQVAELHIEYGKSFVT